MRRSTTGPSPRPGSKAGCSTNATPSSATAPRRRRSCSTRSRPFRLKTCRCTDYANRRQFVADCIQLTPAQADEFQWLPPTCGYRLVAEGKDLPPWHHLVCNDPEAVHKTGISQSGRMLSENSVSEDDWEEHLIFRAG